jgi:hypothetical protein
MARWIITETTRYEVTADTAEAAEALYLEDDQDPDAEFVGVIERTVEPASEDEAWQGDPSLNPNWNR